MSLSATNPRFQERLLPDGNSIMIDTHWVCRLYEEPPFEATQDYCITEQI